ncbi:hypothetical protein GCM10029963_78260 [Micromonospora andamanensis]
MLALLHGPLGDTFEGQTTTAIRLDTPAVCVDISGIDDTDELRTAATLLSTWSYGFAQVEAAHLMADLGLAPARTFFTVLDELWRALRVGHGLTAPTASPASTGRRAPAPPSSPTPSPTWKRCPPHTTGPKPAVSPNAAPCS